MEICCIDMCDNIFTYFSLVSCSQVGQRSHKFGNLVVLSFLQLFKTVARSALALKWEHYILPFLTIFSLFFLFVCSQVGQRSRKFGNSLLDFAIIVSLSGFENLTNIEHICPK